jgi:Trypsin-co-occurring domain 2
MLRDVRAEIERSQALLRGEGKEPLFFIDKMEIEAEVTVGTEGEGGVTVLSVVKFGAKVEAEEVHTIKCTFSTPTDEQGKAKVGVAPGGVPRPTKRRK